MNYKVVFLFSFTLAGIGALQAHAQTQSTPEESYSCAPVAGLETFGQRFAHIADSQLGVCTALTGKRKTGTAKNKTAAAIGESFAACDKAFDALTGANALEAIAGGR